MMSFCGVLADENVETTNAEAGYEESLTGYASEEEFLEELHYSHEDFVRILASLPRDEDNKVDWERSVEEGLIAPSASIDDSDVEERVMDLRVVIKFNDMLIKDVVFSHEVHTFWLNCESCHPKVFIPEVAANRMTMNEIRDGKYCGLCHGVVAFPTNVIDAPNFRANCLRCHRAYRG
jgi:c(7)-type cytochrome triheme protein